MSKNTLIKGTLILTITGFSTRLIGFFYKIYLSNTLGPKNLGVYQLVFPIYGICFTLYASGIQTAISQLVAAETGKSCQGSYKPKKILLTGISCSVSIAVILSLLVHKNASYIAEHIILEPACKSSLKVLSYVFPFCGITSCINGYYYGLKKAAVPATTQLLEQIIRVLSVYVIAVYIGGDNMAVTCELAVLGVVLGEIASNIYNIGSLFITKPSLPMLITQNHNGIHSTSIMNGQSTIVRKLAKLSIPLTGNRLIISLLHSFETILIPSMLQKSGLSNTEALSIYGILTGMSIPFIMFPSTITNSLSVLLLPTVSEAQSVGNTHMITKTTSTTVKYSLLIGLLSTAIFLIFGKSLGVIVFHNQASGTFLMTLAWLCPFLYLSTTLGSIINGMGKTHLTFFNTVIGLALRILFIIYLVPSKGIVGYLIGLLISQLAITLLDYLVVSGSVSFHFNALDWIVKPSLVLVTLGFIVMKVYEYFIKSITLSPLILLFLACITLSVCYAISLFLLKVIAFKDV